MNIIILPYHDWRKIILEGARTRDAHLIDALRAHPGVNNVLIVNRPYTPLELTLKKKNIKIKGQVLSEKKGSKLIQIDTNTYVLDFKSYDLLNHILKGRAWYSKAYTNKHFVSFLKNSIDQLGLKENTYILSQNILAAPVTNYLTHLPIFFDAWDNFMLMPGLASINKLISNNYKLYSETAKKWYTNSQQNVQYYNKHYKPRSVQLLKNGVELKAFKRKHSTPIDLENIPKPIIGFGGKITHLFDAELFRFLIENNPDKSFVVVGQILDKEVFQEIGLHQNFYYLGDKHYSQYPSYVTNFDIGIIPYKTGENQHGGDSIKVYEYLAAGIKVVGTNDNGIESHANHVYLANNKQEFHRQIQTSYSDKKPLDLVGHSWQAKATEIVYDFKNL